jgi:hypothetical protein
MKKSLFFCLIVLFLFSTTGYSLRCGNDLVQKGDTKMEVINCCGEPIYKETVGTVSEMTKIGEILQKIEVPIEKWSYDVGGGVIHVLTFKGDKLVDIDYYRP